MFSVAERTLAVKPEGLGSIPKSIDQKENLLKV